MNILSKHHQEDTIKEWFEQDMEEVRELEQHEVILNKSLQRHSHNPEMRKPIQEYLNDVKILIQNKKEELEHNYGLPYFALLGQFKSKVISQKGQARDSN